MLSYLIVLVLSTLIYEWSLGKICAILTWFDSAKSFHTMRDIKRVKIKTVDMKKFFQMTCMTNGSTPFFCKLMQRSVCARL